MPAEQRPDARQGDEMELCACPECGLPAEVLRDDDQRWDLSEIVRVHCIDRHWFLGPRRLLVRGSRSGLPSA